MVLLESSLCWQQAKAETAETETTKKVMLPLATVASSQAKFRAFFSSSASRRRDAVGSFTVMNSRVERKTSQIILLFLVALFS